MINTPPEEYQWVNDWTEIDCRKWFATQFKKIMKNIFFLNIQKTKTINKIILSSSLMGSRTRWSSSSGYSITILCVCVCSRYFDGWRVYYGKDDQQQQQVVQSSLCVYNDTTWWWSIGRGGKYRMFYLFSFWFGLVGWIENFLVNCIVVAVI